ncbi:MAG: 5-(carboxyamino)imidazole ribonucleotide synthase [Flavobacteriales bacterium]|nr:5-(carboxyamino)imidazole ribonucleotide synthase [Flavobacteriales bacterium]
MKDLFSTSFTLGVLGGGQLGKMMLTETRKYDLRTKVMDPSPEAPCRIGSNEFEVGDLKDEARVLEFAKNVDVLTIEIEHVSTEALRKIKASGTPVHPDPEVLAIIQDKGTQKDFYSEKGIPTAPFELVNTREEALSAIRSGRWNLPCVWKSRTGGYDGFGVSVLRTDADLANIGDGPGLLEEMVPFEMELAVVVARNPSGEVKSYPVVEMEFHPTANQVEYVLAPARVFDEVAEKARALAQRTASELGICGLLAVELFLTKEGDILVNEVAPRPHNSGHWTIEGAYTSQFEQHIRGILNLPLGSTELKAPAVMVNLVGAEGHNGPVRYEGIGDVLHMEGAYPHIYGKKDMRPFRKMGHVTVIAPEMADARKKAEEVKGAIQVISH